MKKAGNLLAKSQTMLFADFGRVTAENMRKLRQVVRDNGGDLKVMKKRLLNVLLKEKGIDYDMRQFEGSVGTIFAQEGLDKIGGPVYRFFQEIASDTKAKQQAGQKLLGAYDVAGKAAFAQATVAMIAQLPPREVLLGQLLGTMAAPITSFLYILDQKSKQTT